MMNNIHYIYKYDKLKYGLFLDSYIIATIIKHLKQWLKTRFARENSDILLHIWLLWSQMIST